MATVSDLKHAEPANAHDELIAALSTFETSLLTPTVSGELAPWLEEVQRSWKDASAQVHFHVKHHHPRQYDEISKQDPELLPRIARLQAEDEAIERQRAQLSLLIGRMNQHIPKLESDEEKASKYTNSIIENGTAFLTQVRKQEVAVQTWYIEAFNRDGGAVD